MFNKEDDLFDEYDEYGVHKGTPDNLTPGGFVIMMLIVILILNYCSN